MVFTWWWDGVARTVHLHDAEVIVGQESKLVLPVLDAGGKDPAATNEAGVRPAASALQEAARQVVHHHRGGRACR